MSKTLFNSLINENANKMVKKKRLENYFEEPAISRYFKRTNVRIKSLVQ